MIRFALLGDTCVSGPDGETAHPIRSTKARGLFAMLLSAGDGKIVPAASLIGALWDDPPRSAVSNLRTHKAELQRALCAAGLSGRIVNGINGAGGYGLRAEAAEVDVLAFRCVARTARDCFRAGDPEAAATLFRAALGLWRGQSGVDLPYTRRLSAISHGLNEDRLVVVEDLALATIGTHMYQDAIADLAQHVAHHPARERAWILLIAAHYLRGNPAGAQAAARRAYRALDDELGLRPGHDLRAAEQAVIRHDLHWFETYLSRSAASASVSADVSAGS